MEDPPVPGPLQSILFRGNDRLQRCAQFDPSHVLPGEPESPHVKKIQEALRQTFDAQIPETEKNYGPETTKAVVAFKTDRNIFTRGTRSIDPIVGINTIHELDELLQDNDRRRRGRGGDGELGTSIIVKPDRPISGDADRAGFSAARLAHTAPGTDWSRRDPFKPITQMIPVGRTRRLLVKSIASAAVSFRIDREEIATIVDSDQGSVTLRGNALGKARLTISVEGFSLVLVELVVRGAQSIPLDVFHLAPPKIPGTAAVFQASLLPGLNGVYESQTNLTFIAGATRDITTMVMDGVPTALDTDLPLFFSEVVGPPIATKPTLRFQDLQREVRNPNAVTVFISPNIRDEQGDNIAGRGGLRTKTAWFKLGLNLNASSLTLPSHEIGHSLGLAHITAPKNETFLMHPVIQINNTIIPSETLEDFII